MEVKAEIILTSEKIFNTILQPSISKKKLSCRKRIESYIVGQTLLNLTLWDSTGFWQEEERILFSPVRRWSVALLLSFSLCLSQVTEIVGTSWPGLWCESASSKESLNAFIKSQILLHEEQNTFQIAKTQSKEDIMEIKNRLTKLYASPSVTAQFLRTMTWLCWFPDQD